VEEKTRNGSLRRKVASAFTKFELLRNQMSKMLSSWKEIAHFFGKGVRTVQRWEKTLDLPIHRPPGAPSNVVLARTSDLEEWMHRGPVSREEGLMAASDLSAISLDSLEREIMQLAELTGVNASVHGETSEERVSSLTDVVTRANAKLAASKAAVRAA
jgi:hypothetical protein